MNPLKPFQITLSGVNLIEASAGTGKTYNITTLYVRALIEKPVTIDQILVMTFTKAATKELKDRLLKRLRKSVYALKNEEHGGDAFLKSLLKHVDNRNQAVDKLTKAIYSFDEAAVYTIHGFCQQVLQQHAFESGAQYDSEIISDDSELVQELIDDYWRKWVAEATGNPKKLAFLKSLKDQKYNPGKLFKEVDKADQLHYKKIVPEENNFNWNEAVEQLQIYFKELQRIWGDYQDEIVDKINYEHLNGNKYRSSSIPGWVTQMDSTLNSDVLPIELFEKFEKFTQSYITDSLNKSAPGPLTHPFFEVAEKYWNIIQELPEYTVKFKLDLLSFLKEELPVKKETLGLVSYSDQLTKIQKALRDGRGDQLATILQKKYPIALVDEYQDTDPVQYDIFQSIYSSGNDDMSFLMIGDPKQSIYGFRGADIFSYLKARNSIPVEKVFSMGSNYRSVPQLIEATNIFWSSSRAPFVIDDISFNPVEAGWNKKKYKQLTENGDIYAPVHFRKLSEPSGEQKNKDAAGALAAEDTATEIQRLLQGGETEKIKIGEKAVTGKDIAVLVRRHEQADLVREALREKGIKSVQYSDRSVFESEEAEQLAYLLQAIISPANEGLVKAALATPLLGYRPQKLLEAEEQSEKWIEILNRFAEWHQTWEEKGFSAMFGQLMKKMDVSNRLAGLPNGERRLTNVFHLAELLQHEEQQRDGMRRLLKWMRQKRKDDQKSAEEEQLRLESDEDLVKIVTIHSSKGLEFPIVFCPYLWHGPYISDKGKVLEYHKNDEAILDFNGKKDENRREKRQRAREEQLAEDMRLAYVAMTRAEHRCYLTWCYARSCEFSSLGYLLYGAEESVGALNHKLEGGFKGLGNETAEEAINNLCKNHPKLFSCEQINMNKQNALDLFTASGNRLRPARTFSRSTPLPAGEMVSSFSSLTRSSDSDPDLPDYDQFLFSADERQEKEARTDMFGFPKGTGPGTCLHKIFEEVDFDDKQSYKRVTAHNLSLYGFSKKWQKVVEQMLDTTFHKELLKSEPAIKLSAIRPDKEIREMEFYYKSSHIEAAELFSIIRENDSSLNKPPGKAARGFLKGFIDLTFEFNGKYYLLDYKSNYLGDDFEDYSQAALEDAVIQSSYDLQYHIYAIALHRFLSNKLPDYSYNKDFGGVFYLFLRGINEDNRSGIFFNKPDMEKIQKLDNYLLEGVKA